MTQPLLSVRGLRTVFRTQSGEVTAVNGVDFEVRPGQVLGIVGESGSGKSVTSLSIMRLIRHPGSVAAGTIEYDGRDLLQLAEPEMRRVRGAQIGMIFQDPMSSLNPYMRISEQIMESTQLHLGLSRGAAADHAVEVLKSVGIPGPGVRGDAYPHQISGGMRQRVMIAMALACKPKLLIADEPTTALDVTIQAQILDLMRKLSQDNGTSMMLITHDLGVIAGMADYVLVMYAGRAFESAPAAQLFAAPRNPYTRALLRSVPNPARRGEKLMQIAGVPPDIARLPKEGCPFAPRCPEAQPRCANETPPVRETVPGHRSFCWIE
jgi:oligopeptide/dipeptide ABC transporter ATP-binding protein